MNREESLLADYEATRAYFLHLAESRFRLLGILPVLTGVALALLAKIQGADIRVAVAFLGLLVTLGLTIYDQRNTQIYDRLVKRAQFLEDQLLFTPCPVTKKETGGAFRDRPKRRWGFIWHDLGLALVYAIALAAWSYLAVMQFFHLSEPSGQSAAWVVAIAIFSIDLALLMRLAWLNDQEQLPTNCRPGSGELLTGEAHNKTTPADVNSELRSS